MGNFEEGEGKRVFIQLGDLALGTTSAKFLHITILQ